MSRNMAELRAGERGWVCALRLSPLRAAPLLRLGLFPGTEVQCLRRSPLGDPIAYRFRGTTVALRSLDTKQIVVQPEKVVVTPQLPALGEKDEIRSTIDKLRLTPEEVLP